MLTVPIIYEDDSLLVVDKPAGLLVHPTAGEQGKTLVDWLRDHVPGIEQLNWPDPGRPGIVHRLDRDTSGVLVIAKTPEALANLQKQFSEREISKTYLALVAGNPEWNTRTVRAVVSRDEGTRRKASYLKLPGEVTREAETEFRILKQLTLADWPHPQRLRLAMAGGGVSLIEARPKTGRTHQIRIHLGLIELPILGDPWYQTKLSKKLSTAFDVPRLMLHAKEIAFSHPASGQKMTFSAPIPADLQSILDKFEAVDN